MNKAELFDKVTRVLNESGCSKLAAVICAVLMDNSKGLTIGCYITLSVPTESVFIVRSIEHAWRDIEDLAGGFGKLNEILTDGGSELEFFAAHGLMENGKYKGKVSSKTRWVTYWLCKRSDQQKQDNLEEIPLTYLQLAAQI